MTLTTTPALPAARANPFVTFTRSQPPVACSSSKLASPLPRPGLALAKRPAPRPSSLPPPRYPLSITRLSGPHNPELVALLLDRAAFLPTYDRALIEAIFRQRRTAAGVAAVFNVPASTMRRRILSIACRCFSPSYAFVAQCRDTWPPTTRRVATALVLGGLPMREASLQLGLTLHVTRIHRDVILTMVSTATSLGAVDPAAALARRSCA